jgi:hypothetical protein
MLFLAFHGLTNLRSVTWTKVSLKEAKIRATPKTSSPVEAFLLVFQLFCFCYHQSFIVEGSHTIANGGSEGDVLLGSTGGGLLGRHFENGRLLVTSSLGV